MAVAQAEPREATKRSKSQAGEDGRVNAADLPPNEMCSLMFNLPAGLRAILQEDASKRGISLAALMRINTAEHYGYDLPVVLRQSTARRKYATPEEALAAKKAKADEQRRIVRAINDAYASGDPNARELMESLGILPAGG